MNDLKITESLLKELFSNLGEDFIFYPDDFGEPIEVHFEGNKSLEDYEKIQRMKNKKENFEEWRKRAGL